ncbi:MAG: hypothetical protein RJQ07_00790 [Pseudomonadales bacterium]
MAPSFPDTPWSLIAQANQGAAERRAAMQQLLERYWQPVYAAMVGGWSVDESSAKSLVAEFFTTLLSRESLAQLDSENVRFRDYLKEQLSTFMTDKTDADALGATPEAKTNLNLVEPLEIPQSEGDAFTIFDEQWMLLIIQRAIARLREESRADPLNQFEIFSMFDIEGTASTVEEVAADLDLRPDQVRRALTQVRKKLRNIVSAEISEYSTTQAGAREELTWLLL